MANDREPETETGAEGGASADTKTPFSPRKDDDSPLGSTDQHSKVPHNGTPEQDAIKQDGANAD